MNRLIAIVVAVSSLSASAKEPIPYKPPLRVEPVSVVPAKSDLPQVEAISLSAKPGVKVVTTPLPAAGSPAMPPTVSLKLPQAMAVDPLGKVTMPYWLATPELLKILYSDRNKIVDIIDWDETQVNWRLPTELGMEKAKFRNAHRNGQWNQTYQSAYEAWLARLASAIARREALGARQEP